MPQKNNRTHDWRKIKWPFTATFLYYSLLSLFTGTVEQSAIGFATVLFTVFVVDAFAYGCYVFFLARDEENTGKLWFAFVLTYLFLSYEQLGIVWQLMQARAGTL